MFKANRQIKNKKGLVALEENTHILFKHTKHNILFIGQILKEDGGEFVCIDVDGILSSDSSKGYITDNEIVFKNGNMIVNNEKYKVYVIEHD